MFESYLQIQRCEVFKATLDGALSNLVWWKVSLPMAGGLELMIFKVPSNSSRSMMKMEGRA